jgi:hypothetical protein
MQRLTREQAAVLSAFTGVLCGPFDDLHEYAAKKLGDGIGPVGMAMAADELKEAARADMEAIIATKETEQ